MKLTTKVIDGKRNLVVSGGLNFKSAKQIGDMFGLAYDFIPNNGIMFYIGGRGFQKRYDSLEMHLKKDQVKKETDKQFNEKNEYLSDLPKDRINILFLI